MLWTVALVSLAVATPKESPASHDRPVQMTAKGGLRIDLSKNLGWASGDVVIKRDDVLVCCDEAEARYSGSRIEEVSCRGRVVIVRPDGTRASADRAVFRAADDRLTLTGAAQLTAREAFVQGEEIVYEIAKDQLYVRGKKSRFDFEPNKARAAPPGRPCPPPDTP